MTDTASALAAYGRFFEELTRQNLAALAGLVTPDIRFKDPFNDVRGVERMIAALDMMFDHGTPRFEVLDRAVGGNGGYLLWRFTSTPAAGGAPLVVVGMSAIAFAADGRVREHIDHWDAAGQFYELLPVIGSLIRLIKKKLALPKLRSH